MDETALWTPHLKPGERLVWQAEASMALRRADIARARFLAGVVGGASAIVAVLFALRFIETVFPVNSGPNLGAAVAAPLYFAFALAMAALSLWGLRRLNPKPSAATRFAATNLRLISLAPDGALVDQIAGAEIDGIVAGGRRRTPDLYVLRKNDDKEERVFSIEHIERPLEAKAIIEQEFLETAP